MAQDTYERPRLSIPKEDITVIQWCRAQRNLSYSMRQIIREYVKEHGIQDVTCAPIQVRNGNPVAPPEPRPATETPAVQKPQAITQPKPAVIPRTANQQTVQQPANPNFMDPADLLG